MSIAQLLDDAALRRLSQRVFGQERLLSVAIALIQAKRPMTASELVGVVGVNNASSLSAPLQRLLAGGFIEEVPLAAASDRSRPYQRREGSAFWQLVEELYERASSDGAMF